MEMHLPNTFLNVHQKKSCDFVLWDGKTWLTSEPMSFTASEMWLWSFWNAWAKSVAKVFLYNCLPELLQEYRHPPPKAMTTFIVFRLLALRRKSFIMYENDYTQWLLLLFFVIYSAGLSGSDNFILFDSLDGNSAYLKMF